MPRALLFALLLALLPAAQAHPTGNSRYLEALHSSLDTPEYKELPPLDAKVWSTFSPAPGVLADRVSYTSSAGILVPAIVYRPDPATTHVHGKLPALIVVNGHGSDKFGWYAFYSGILFARAGAVVLTYDPIGEGERNSQRLSHQSPSPHDADVTPPAPLPHDDWGKRLAGLMQVDLMQAVRYLDAQPWVDSHRIGVLGYSMGAFVAGLAGAMDADQHRIAAIVLSGGGTFDDGPGYYDANKNPCQGPPYRALAYGLDDERGQVIFGLNADSHPMLVVNGTADTVMDIADHDAAWFGSMREQVLANAAHKDNVFTSIIYAGVSHRPSWLNRDGVEWLNDHLHFAFWDTSAKIESEGTTHISAWAKAHNVFIAPNYLREDREGGIDAVGRDIPALTRAQLTVLPDADWRALKDRLTYEAWAAKTLAAEQAVADNLMKHVPGLHEPETDFKRLVPQVH